MTKLIRNTSDEQSRLFWESVDRSAAGIADAPQWMKAGITISERHFETFTAREEQLQGSHEEAADDE